VLTLAGSRTTGSGREYSEWFISDNPLFLLGEKLSSIFIFTNLPGSKRTFRSRQKIFTFTAALGTLAESKPNNITHLMNWYYVQGGQQMGPVTEADLENLFQTGVIKSDTMIWREGMANWQPYAAAKGGAGPAVGAPAGGVVCSECGKVFPPDEVIKHGNSYVCAACKPAFIQKLKEGASFAGTLEYAGFGIRFAAYIVDSIVNFIFGLASGFAVALIMRAETQRAMVVQQLVASGVGMVLGLVYYTFFVGKYGATPGKMVCRLKIVSPDGSPVGYKKAVGRYFGYWVSSIICGIGFLMIAFDEERRGLHDRICGTRVIKVPSR
jgi:uncharacterized RDD family membrane protein YckC